MSASTQAGNLGKNRQCHRIVDVKPWGSLFLKEVRVVAYSFSFLKSLLLILSYVELRLIRKIRQQEANNAVIPAWMLESSHRDVFELISGFFALRP